MVATEVPTAAFSEPECRASAGDAATAPLTHGLFPDEEESTIEIHLADGRSPTYVTITLESCGRVFVAGATLDEISAFDTGTPYIRVWIREVVTLSPESLHVSLTVPEFSDTHTANVIEVLNGTVLIIISELDA